MERETEAKEHDEFEYLDIKPDIDPVPYDDGCSNAISKVRQKTR